MGCSAHDDEARIDGVSGAVAAGAFVRLTVYDACTGGNSGKGPPTDLCSRELVESVDSVSSARPDIARIVSRDEWPPVGFMDGSDRPIVVEALTPGVSEITMAATFSDGSKRTATMDLQVLPIERVELQAQCDVDAKLPLRAPSGDSIGVNALYFNGSEQLAGRLVEPLSGPGLSCMPACNVTLSAAQVRLTSRLDPAFGATFETYGPSDVAQIVVAPDLSAGRIYAPGQTLELNGLAALKGGKPCHQLPLEAETLTPDICSGALGARVVPATDSGSFPVLAQRTGRCQLLLRAVGATKSTTHNVDLRVVSAATVERVVATESSCTEPDKTGCSFGFTTTMICRDGTWQLATQCKSGQACELVARGKNGCDRAEGCTACVR